VTTPPVAAQPVDPARALVGFARTLQAAGVAASTERVQTMARCLGVLDPRRRADVYWAGRLTLCASPDDVTRYDRAFAAYFAGERPTRSVRGGARPVGHVAADPGGGPAPHPRDPDGPDEPARVVASASRTEVLAHRDIALLTAVERAELNRLLAALALPGELRRTRRFEPAHRGDLDPRRTIRETLRRGGETTRLHRRRHRRRPRRVVLLVDVSGSMRCYADALLRFAHAAARRRRVPTEVLPSAPG
jgi:hypothetical protein